MERIDEDRAAEIRELMVCGFEAAWVKDLKIGDIFKFARTFSFDKPQPLMVVERIQAERAGYVGEDGYVDNRVINMIVTDEDGLQRDICYGDTNGVYVWRG